MMHTVRSRQAGVPAQLHIVSMWAVATSYPNQNKAPRRDGQILVHLQFPADSQFSKPGSSDSTSLQIREDEGNISPPYRAIAHFPTYIKIHDKRFIMTYRNRQPTCSYCKEHRPDPQYRHSLEDCSRRLCNSCGQPGHFAASCPSKQPETQDDTPYFASKGPPSQQQQQVEKGNDATTSGVQVGTNEHNATSAPSATARASTPDRSVITGDGGASFNLHDYSLHCHLDH